MWKKIWESLLLSLSLPLLSVRLGPMSQERSQDRKGCLQSMKGQEGGRWCCDEGEGPVKGICAYLWVSGLVEIQPPHTRLAMAHEQIQSQIRDLGWVNRLFRGSVLSMHTHVVFDSTVSGIWILFKGLSTSEYTLKTLKTTVIMLNILLSSTF